MVKIRYKKPVLLEAVCELKFPADNKWGMSSYIKFADLANKAGYPEVVDAPDGFEFNFALGVDKQPEVKPISRRIQTWNEDKTKLWQAAPNLFAANVRGPYHGWEKFRPHILNGIEVYSKVAQPKKAEMLQMTYINKIDFGNSQPSDYLNFLPPSDSYADFIENFGCFTQQLFKNGDTILVTSGRDLTLNTNAVMLNIVYTSKSPSLVASKIKEIIQRAHDRILETFLKSLTDKQKERMEAI